MELKHLDVVDEERHGWDYCLAGHSVLFCHLDGFEGLLGDQLCLLFVRQSLDRVVVHLVLA